MSASDNSDDAGGWTKVVSDSGYVYDIYIGQSEDQPELEDMLAPPGKQPKTHNAQSG